MESGILIATTSPLAQTCPLAFFAIPAALDLQVNER